MNEIKKMTMRELKRELDRHYFGLKEENRKIADLMTEIVERMNRREFAYIGGCAMIPEKRYLGVSCYTHNDYPEEIRGYEIEILIDYEDMNAKDRDDFLTFFWVKLPEGWMVTRREYDTSSCQMSWYVARNCNWLPLNERG